MAFIICVASCKNTQVGRVNPETLMQADLDFSEYSVTHGMNAAFTAFADSSAILLRPNTAPVKGIGSITRLLNQKDDSGFNLSWEPGGADISASGDIGYTWGIYTVSAGTNRQKGTYVTIWKKNSAGEWKFVLDSGNAGIGEKEGS